MAWYDEFNWEGADEFLAPPNPDFVNEILFGRDDIVDMHAQNLFVEAFFNDNPQAYQDLVDYMYEQYNIDFEHEFEWEDFREWYDSQ